MVQVTDAGVVGADPVGGREGGVEDFVHVLVDGNVGIEEDGGGEVGQGEGAEFGPGVFEAGCDGRS